MTKKEIGETEIKKNATQDVNDLDEIESTLKSIDIKPKNIFGKWKKTNKLLKGIAKEWNKISEDDKKCLSSLITGDKNKVLFNEIINNQDN